MLSRSGRLISHRKDEVYRIRDDQVSQETDFVVPTKASIKDHLNLAHRQDDAHIMNLRDTVTDFFERVTGHHLQKQQRVVEFDGPSQEYMIPRAPWVSLDDITKYDEGETTSLDTSDYYVEQGPPAYVNEKTGVAITAVTSLEITYTVGYASEDDVPSGIKHVLRIMIGDLYEYRTSAPISGQSLQEVPFDWEQIVAPYRVITL